MYEDDLAVDTDLVRRGIEVPCAAEVDPALQSYRGGTPTDIAV